MARELGSRLLPGATRSVVALLCILLALRLSHRLQYGRAAQLEFLCSAATDVASSSPQAQWWPRMAERTRCPLHGLVLLPFRPCLSDPALNEAVTPQNPLDAFRLDVRVNDLAQESVPGWRCPELMRVLHRDRS